MANYSRKKQLCHEIQLMDTLISKTAIFITCLGAAVILGGRRIELTRRILTVQP
jgi:hypothetical protein